MLCYYTSKDTQKAVSNANQFSRGQNPFIMIRIFHVESFRHVSNVLSMANGIPIPDEPTPAN